MKTKSFEKRLSLNKNTIVNLNGETLHNIRGGGETIDGMTCMTCPPGCPNPTEDTLCDACG